jgi:lipid A 3-O-deacylase
MKDAQSRVCPRLLVTVLLLLAPFPLVPALAGSIVDEVKAGVLAHDIGFLGDSVEGGADIGAEVLFKSPDFLQVIGAPRPTIGGWVNTNGKTDYLYFDMTWTATVSQPILQQDGMYVGVFLGGAVHDGRSSATTPTATRTLGHALYFT